MKEYQSQDILISDEKPPLSMRIYEVSDHKINNKCIACANLFLRRGGQDFGNMGIHEHVKILKNISGGSKIIDNKITICEKDQVIFMRAHAFEATKVQRKSTNCMSIADENDSITLESIIPWSIMSNFHTD